MKTLLLIATITLLTACGANADERFDTGYSDGYAEGYNTTCKIRSTLVEADWDNKDYTRGYQSGRRAGASKCRSDS